MAAADRLSALPDDTLQRILSFTPAASAVLSRRWRTLWSRTSTVDSRLDSKAQPDSDWRYSPTFHAFYRDAKAVLNARRAGGGGTGLKRLALFLERNACRRRYGRCYSNALDAEPEPDRRAAIEGLLVDPAVARLEEFSLTFEDYDSEYAPTLASLPCAATLRVLELHHCNLRPPSCSDVVFPSLTDLTLDGCVFSEGYLQLMVDAAPALASLALVNISQKSPDAAKIPWHLPKNFKLPLRLRCPTATDLVVVVEKNVSEKELEASAHGGIELDMPGLQFFRYRGYPIKLSLTSPAPGLARVDLDVAKQLASCRMKYEPPSRMLTDFSSMSSGGSRN